MNRPKLLLLTFLLLAGTGSMAQDKSVALFDKVIISPHIEATLIQGAEEAVSIEKTSVTKDKINIEVKGKTLRIYLDDAKEVTKNETVFQNGYKRKSPIYKGTQVSVTITYRDLQELAVRGEENIVMESSLNREKFRIKVYGEPTVVFHKLHLGLLRTTIYGTGNLKIISGSVKQQEYTVYGEANVDAMEVFNNTTRITSYGAAEFKINASKEIKVTAYGNALVEYSGDARIRKGLVIGGLDIKKFQQKNLTSDVTLKHSLNKNISKP